MPGRVQICTGEVREGGPGSVAGKAGAPESGVPSVWEDEGVRAPPRI